MAQDYVSEMVVTVTPDLYNAFMSEKEMDLSREFTNDIAVGDTITMIITRNKLVRSVDYFYLTIIGAKGFQVLSRCMIPTADKEYLEKFYKDQTGVS